MAEKEISLDDFLKDPKMYKKMDDEILIKTIVEFTKQLSKEDADPEKVKQFRSILRDIYKNDEQSPEVRKTARVSHGILSKESETKGMLPVRKRPSEEYDAANVFRKNLENLTRQEPPLYPEEKQTVKTNEDKVVKAIQDPEMNGFLPEDGSVSQQEFGELWTTASFDPDEQERKAAAKELGEVFGGAGLAKLEGQIGKESAKKMVGYLKEGDIDKAMEEYNKGYEKKWGSGTVDDAPLNAYHGKVKEQGYILEKTADGLQLWRGRVGIQFIFPEGTEKLQQEIMRRTASGPFFAMLGVGFSAIDSFLTYDERVVRIDSKGTTETKGKEVKELNKNWYDYASVNATMAVGANNIAAVFKVQVEKNEQSIKIIPLSKNERGGAGTMPAPLIPWIADLQSVTVKHGSLGPNAKAEDYWDIQLTIGRESERWGFMNLGYDVTFKLLALGVQGTAYTNIDLGDHVSFTVSFSVSSDRFNELLYGPGLGIDIKFYKELGVFVGANALINPNAKPGEVGSEVSGTLLLNIPLSFKKDDE